MIISGCEYDNGVFLSQLGAEPPSRRPCAAKHGRLLSRPCRPLNFKNACYNQNLSPGSILLEFGTDANTLEEAVYSGELVGKCLVQTLKGL